MYVLKYATLICLCLVVATMACGGRSNGAPSPAPTSTPTSTATPAYTTYVSEEHGFSISYPSDWKIEDTCTQCGGPLFALKTPYECQNTSTKFELRKENLSPVEIMETRDLFESKIQEALSNLEQYTPIFTQEVIAYERNAIKHTFTYTAEVVIFITMLIVVDNDTCWYVACTCAEDCAGQCEEIFDDIAGSFHILNP